MIHGTADRPVTGCLLYSDGATQRQRLPHRVPPSPGRIECVVPASERRQVASLDASVRTERVTFSHLSSGSGAPLTCVRALSGFGTEQQGVSRQRASPGISVSSLTAFDLLGLASTHGCTWGQTGTVRVVLDFVKSVNRKASIMLCHQTGGCSV